MTRVAVVIGSALAFAVIALIAGHLCVTAYSGVTIDVGGNIVRAYGGERPSTEFLFFCYFAPPFIGALVGFVLSIMALKTFGPPAAIG
jgi:hypothetical protein